MEAGHFFLEADMKEKPLWWKLYFDPVYPEICRAVGYKGTTYRELLKTTESLASRFDKQHIQKATDEIVFLTRDAANPKPTTPVKLRDRTVKIAWQLLGDPPGHKSNTVAQQLDHML